MDGKLKPNDVSAHLQKAGGNATYCDSIPAGVTKAKELAGKDGVVLCFGSLYSVGEIQKAL